jgi:hypothetical protein
MRLAGALAPGAGLEGPVRTPGSGAIAPDPAPPSFGVLLDVLAVPPPERWLGLHHPHGELRGRVRALFSRPPTTDELRTDPEALWAEKLAGWYGNWNLSGPWLKAVAAAAAAVQAPDGSFAASGRAAEDLGRSGMTGLTVAILAVWYR